MTTKSIRVNSTLSAVELSPDDSLRRTWRLQHILRDLGGVVLIASTSLAVALVMNRFSSRPLPMVYETPELRLQAELAQLITSPAFLSMPINMVDLAEFRAAVQSRKELILDARSSAFYQLGHVPGALNLARDNFALDYLRLRSKIDQSRDRRVIVYCSGGSCRDSKMVAQALMSLGVANVAVFAGGWTQWTEAGLAEERG
jgi:rhodanese-related sulfurtransferase